ncbi:MAG: DNA mismatch repair endonuclease MutL [bacterium]
MGSIRLLPDILASQVAAGEVVERPASVVKELVENSIDAGARRITVEFHGGGARLIRVTDDGCGMDRSDALLCLERHATSKIREIADLSAITTMGFRGEALPSIASVSRFKLSTRRREDEVGTLIEVTGGKIHEVQDSGEAPGTRIEVGDLFFNVPARRKFLRGEQTEAANLLQQIEILAVAHPEIAFTCIRDDREVFRLAATEDLAVRLRDLHGEAFIKKLIPLSPIENQGVRVHGWIARPGEGRSDRTLQMTFVNGRMIRSPILSLPLREACDGVLAKGLHPPAVLFFEMDPAAVDCNVHPAKREVRFRDPGVIRSVALMAARSAWGAVSQHSVSLGDFSPGPGSDPLFPPITKPAWNPSTISFQRDLPVWEVDSARVAESPVPNASGFRSQASGLSAPRYLGQLAGRYLLFEEQEGLMLLEIRAARGRILYERFLAQLGSGSLGSQRLLIPEVLEMSPADLAWIDAHSAMLEKAGLVAESFGQGGQGSRGGGGGFRKGSLKVDAVPADASSLPVMEIVVRLVDELRSLGEAPSLDKTGREALASSVARLAAAGARMPAGEEAARMLLLDLLSCDLPYATPKGRPTMSQISPGELTRRFTA